MLTKLNSTAYNLRNRKRNKKGFTLAELLIVVAIIAILVAIAIPAFSNSLKQAKIGVEQANARSTHGQAMTSYMVFISNPSATGTGITESSGVYTFGTVNYGGIDYDWTYEPGSATNAKPTVKLTSNSTPLSGGPTSYSFDD